MNPPTQSNIQNRLSDAAKCRSRPLESAPGIDPAEEHWQLRTDQIGDGRPLEPPLRRRSYPLQIFSSLARLAVMASTHSPPSRTRRRISSGAEP